MHILRKIKLLLFWINPFLFFTLIWQQGFILNLCRYWDIYCYNDFLYLFRSSIYQTVDNTNAKNIILIQVIILLYYKNELQDEKWIDTMNSVLTFLLKKWQNKNASVFFFFKGMHFNWFMKWINSRLWYLLESLRISESMYKALENKSLIYKHKIAFYSVKHNNCDFLMHWLHPRVLIWQRCIFSNKRIIYVHFMFFSRYMQLT